MTTEQPNKIDLSTPRTTEQLKNLLQAVNVNLDGVLTKREQDYYKENIEYLITGKKLTKASVFKGIQDGMADIDDICG